MTVRLIKFTPEGLAELKQKERDLKDSRPGAVKELSRAREMGDLSENGLYTAAKQRLRSIDSQLRRLDYMIKLADVVDSKKIVVEENGREITYEIVGDTEADPLNNKITLKSPIGRVLHQKKVGDTAEISTPKGIRTLKIVRTT
ncbi:MAG TPA: GreA/GreB family elongation factor [Patescibacteria group bacterium]|nr:GreA/GreB family elongation factor [Patescibacteria group bacterium]